MTYFLKISTAEIERRILEGYEAEGSCPFCEAGIPHAKPRGPNMQNIPVRTPEGAAIRKALLKHLKRT